MQTCRQRVLRHLTSEQDLSRYVEEAGIGIEEELVVLDGNHFFFENWKML
jgi:3-mercaptopyruvate sulfurtransferase SseA